MFIMIIAILKLAIEFVDFSQEIFYCSGIYLFIKKSFVIFIVEIIKPVNTNKKGSDKHPTLIIPIYFNSKNYFFFVNPPSNKQRTPL